MYEDFKDLENANEIIDLTLLLNLFFTFKNSDNCPSQLNAYTDGLSSGWFYSAFPVILSFVLTVQNHKNYIYLFILTYIKPKRKQMVK